MAKKKPEVKADGWANLFTKLNHTTRDKRTGAYVTSASLSQQDLRSLYRCDDMAARIVDALPFDALREGYDVRVSEDEDMSEMLEAEHKRLLVSERLTQALTWERLFGGAAILLGVNDGQKDLSQPLNPGSVRTIDYLTVFEPEECNVVEWENNPLAANYGSPRMYQIFPRGLGIGAAGTLTRVHASRIIWLSGMMVDRWQLVERKGFGDSVLERPYHVLRNFGLSWEAASSLIEDFAQAVFKVQGLADAMASDKENLIINRIASLDMARSTLRALLLDAGTAGGEGAEDFERKTTPLSGLPELLDKMCLRLAAAAKMPVSLLMGQSPAGLNATGQADIQFWYNEVKAFQDSRIKHVLCSITDMVIASKMGPAKGKSVEYSIQFRPLWQPTEQEISATRVAMANADVAYITAGVLTEDEVRMSRFGGEKYSLDTAVEGELMSSEGEGPSEDKE